MWKKASKVKQWHWWWRTFTLSSDTSIQVRQNRVNHVLMLSTTSYLTRMKLGQFTLTIHENLLLQFQSWGTDIKHQQSMWTVQSRLWRGRSGTCLKAHAQTSCSQVFHCSIGQWLCSISPWQWMPRHSSTVMMPHGNSDSKKIFQVSWFLSVQRYCFGTIQKGLTTHLERHHQQQMMESFWDTTFNLVLHGKVSILLPS